MSERQTQAAKRNIKRAQRAAKSKRTLANLPERTRRGLTEEARKGRARGGKPGHALEDRNREQLLRGGPGDGSAGPLQDGQVGADRRDPRGPLS